MGKLRPKDGEALGERQPFLLTLAGATPPGPLSSQPWRARTLPGSPLHCWNKRNVLPSIELKLTPSLPLWFIFLCSLHGKIQLTQREQIRNQFILKEIGADRPGSLPGSLCHQTWQPHHRHLDSNGTLLLESYVMVSTLEPQLPHLQKQGKQ